MSIMPVAIVGQACLLPGANNPKELWSLISNCQIAIGDATAEHWRANPERLLLSSKSIINGENGCISKKGGFVTGFDSLFDPTGFELDAELISVLDTPAKWLLHAGREALRDAGIDSKTAICQRMGAIVGNLAYPTAGLSKLAESYWLSAAGLKSPYLSNPIHRFSAGLPAHVLCQSLGLGGQGFALDAACASSLYAFKLACDQLRDGEADAMLAGGICNVDGLVLHSGFTALKALSPTGQSRPFNKLADGLLPSEGVALFVLKRLPDAIKNKDRILGVIRGIGLSNDGKTGGFLVPSKEGQLRAMKAAYLEAGLTPGQVSLIECHATGTATGDAIEIAALSELFSGVNQELAIGSLKSNLGHLITASGAASLMKMVLSMEHHIKPATLNAEPTLPELENSPFRALHKAEPWEADGAKLAAISGFGFGGANAHLLIEEWLPSSTTVRLSETLKKHSPAKIAVVGLGARIANHQDVKTYRQQLLKDENAAINAEQMASIGFNQKNIKFPPKDLASALPQQLAILSAIEEALTTVSIQSNERTSVLIGMQCDAEGARYGMRLRLPELFSDITLKEGCTPLMQASSVIGCMPNIPANRINIQYDFGGPSFSLFSEELSGIRAIKTAMRALATQEIDVAITGAVDLSIEPVHESAAKAVLSKDKQVAGDAACILILKREEDAIKDGDTIHAILDLSCTQNEVKEWQNITVTKVGHAHAASGMVELLSAILSVRDGIHPAHNQSQASPWLKDREARTAKVTISALGNQQDHVFVKEPDCSTAQPLVPENSFDILFFQSDTKEGLITAIENNVYSETADSIKMYRLAVLANKDQKSDAINKALIWLKTPSTTLPKGVFYGEGEIMGDVGFIFTGAATAYAGMGREQVLAFPSALVRVNKRHPYLASLANKTYQCSTSNTLNDFNQLCGSSFLSQFHAELSQNLLGIKPKAVLGLSSGETNSLIAMNAWESIEKLLIDIQNVGLYDVRLAGEYLDVKEWWKNQNISGNSWSQYQIFAPIDDVKAAVSQEKAVHIGIICSPKESVIVGESNACDRIAKQFGQRCVPINMQLAVHTPAIGNCGAIWRELHHRPTQAIEGINFYGNAHGCAYEITADNVADALANQAMDTVDLPKTILQAWNDGVRIFIEHGPRGECSRWISEILHDKPHAAISFDNGNVSGLSHLIETVAKLLTLGVPLNLNSFRNALNLDVAEKTVEKNQIMFSSHLTPMVFLDKTKQSKTDLDVEIMRQAPLLPVFIPSITAEPEEIIETKQNVIQEEIIAQPVVVNSAKQIAYQQVNNDIFSSMHRALSEAHHQYLQQAKALFERQLQVESLLLKTSGGYTVNTVSQNSHEKMVSVKIDMPLKSSKHAPENKASVVHQHKPIISSEKSMEAPLYDRKQLEILASGRIADVFGELFSQQENYHRQVRMPEPPLLLCDRVMSISGEPGTMKTGVIVTETDVTPDAWYLHQGRMPPGITIESGQADLLLISWLGADFENKSDRVYRLLGCELTFEGSLPKVGETLHYDIHVDGHARQGDTRLFFFHYDCHVDGKLRLKVRNGQAGFFSDKELAESAGVLWDAETAEPTPIEQARVSKGELVTSKRQFNNHEVSAFVNGNLSSCFGDEFLMTDSHTRTPRTSSGNMQLIKSISHFDPEGGPWKRGYLRSEWDLSPNDWFFSGHFKNDPCMPGTLMADACLQAMSFYMAAMGYTINRDGWRFEPVAHETFKFICRGQAIPSSKHISYEVFVDELIDGPEPTLYADILATVDGLKGFYCRRMGIKLVPDWPMEERTEFPDDSAIAVAEFDKFKFNQKSLLACATGKPTDAFGYLYAPFDSHRKAPRLPGEPYLFMSRIKSVSEPMGTMKIGTEVVAEYDIPEDAWYFNANGYKTMPYAVLLEAALQPCGWLASYIGCTLQSDQDLCFRNLDGTATQIMDILPNSGTLITRSKLTSLSRVSTMTIVGFDVECSMNGKKVYQMTTVFGFFPPEALIQQVGLSVAANESDYINRKSNYEIEPSAMPALASAPLLMLDKINGFWPTEGSKGLGVLRAEKKVNPGEWFFKAHFFQDPVQPGSLGVEALLQLLQSYIVLSGEAQGFTLPRFEPIALNKKAIWKYRGQVVPSNRKISSLIEITEKGRDENGVYVLASGSLWVDDKKIYEMSEFGMRIVEADPKCVNHKSIKSAKGSLLSKRS